MHYLREYVHRCGMVTVDVRLISFPALCPSAHAQEKPLVGRMVLIPLVIPSKELGGYPKVVTEDRFCGVCLGVTKPKPTRVFEALYVDSGRDGARPSHAVAEHA